MTEDNSGNPGPVQDFGKMFKAFGAAVGEIFNDPELKEKANEFGKSVTESASTFGSRFKDEEVKRKFRDVGEAAQQFGRSVTDTFRYRKDDGMNKTLETENVIRTHVLWSLGAGLMPIPLLDIAAVTAIQVDMLRQLAGFYKVDYTRSDGKAFVAALTGGTFARIGASVVKAVPGIGSVVGGVSMSVMSAASTYAVGQVACHYFASGSDILHIDVTTARQKYDEEYEKGKQVAADLEKERGLSSEKYKIAFETIGNLEKLKQSGVMSEEDFETVKRKVLDGL